ncbi:MAG TPA: S1/P1 nuclease, partial [Kiritimatiellia bacterium]|nr:S1/P1 nuclease [Kiritimatiellia bacterium]
MKHARQSILFAAILGVAVLPRAQAWGPEGHEIVAEIALRYLTSAARAAVDDVLGTYKLGDYDVASWPDT